MPQLLCLRPNQVCKTLGRVLDGNGGQAQFGAARLDLCQIKEVVDQFEQASAGRMMLEA